MIGVITAEYARLLQRQSNGQANRVYNGELTSWANPARGDDDVGTSKKRKRVIAKGGKVRTRRATKDVVETGADDDDDGEREEVSDDDVGSRAILRAPFGRRLGLALALRSHVLKTSPELMRCCLSPVPRRRQVPLPERRRRGGSGGRQFLRQRSVFRRNANFTGAAPPPTAKEVVVSATCQRRRCAHRW